MAAPAGNEQETDLINLSSEKAGPTTAAPAVELDHSQLKDSGEEPSSHAAFREQQEQFLDHVLDQVKNSITANQRSILDTIEDNRLAIMAELHARDMHRKAEAIAAAEQRRKDIAQAADDRQLFLEHFARLAAVSTERSPIPLTPVTPAKATPRAPGVGAAASTPTFVISPSKFLTRHSEDALPPARVTLTERFPLRPDNSFKLVGHNGAALNSDTLWNEAKALLGAQRDASARVISDTMQNALPGTTPTSLFFSPNGAVCFFVEANQLPDAKSASMLKEEVSKRQGVASYTAMLAAAEKATFYEEDTSKTLSESISRTESAWPKRVFLAIIATISTIINLIDSAFSYTALLTAAVKKYVDPGSLRNYPERVRTGYDLIRMMAYFVRGSALTRTTVNDFAKAVHWPSNAMPHTAAAPC